MLALLFVLLAGRELRCQRRLGKGERGGRRQGQPTEGEGSGQEEDRRDDGNKAHGEGRVGRREGV